MRPAVITPPRPLLCVDVAVVGAGPAGVAAAVSARASGASVAIVDRYPAIGGQIYKRAFDELDDPAPVSLPRAARRWSRRLAASGAHVLVDTCVWGVRDRHTLLTASADGRAGAVCARALVLATGAYDRPVAFPGWTLPGVMTAGAAQALVKAQATLPGRRVLVAGAGPFLLPVAVQLKAAGAQIVAVAEATRRRSWLAAAPRMLGHPRRLGAYARYRARLRGVPFLWGHMLVRVEGVERAERAALAVVDGRWRPLPGSERTVDVDTVCTAYGFVPALELARALGCELAGDAVAHDDDMRTSVPHVHVAGEAAGVGGADLAVLEGMVAGRVAAAAGVPAGLARRRRHSARFARLLDDLFGPRPALGELAASDTVVCRCEDVTAGAVDDAVAAGATSLSAIKIATRCGQGPCQGRMCEGPVAARLPFAVTGSRYSSRVPLRPVAMTTLIDDVTANSS
jgi:NADPH-dependent 2,4-dienoyl-CoA reductase/sulfur reductase-like enzyme